MKKITMFLLFCALTLCQFNFLNPAKPSRSRSKKTYSVANRIKEFKEIEKLIRKKAEFDNGIKKFRNFMENTDPSFFKIKTKILKKTYGKKTKDLIEKINKKIRKLFRKEGVENLKSMLIDFAFIVGKAVTRIPKYEKALKKVFIKAISPPSSDDLDKIIDREFQGISRINIAMKSVDKKYEEILSAGQKSTRLTEIRNNFARQRNGSLKLYREIESSFEKKVELLIKNLFQQTPNPITKLLDHVKSIFDKSRTAIFAEFHAKEISELTMHQMEFAQLNIMMKRINKRLDTIAKMQKTIVEYLG